MLNEIHRSESGILFDDYALRDLGIPTDTVPPLSTKPGPAEPDLQAAPASQADPVGTSVPARPPVQRTGFSSFLRILKFKVKTTAGQDGVPAKETRADQASKSCSALDATDVLTPLHDQLVANPLWWLLQTPTWYPGEFWCVPSPRRTWYIPCPLVSQLVPACSSLTTGLPSPHNRPDFSGKRRFPTDEHQLAYQRIHHSVEIRVDKAPDYLPRAKLPSNWKEYIAP